MPLLEVIACSVADAIAAERGGAGRLELVRALDVGGLTPPLPLVREIVKSVSIPVRVMVRENAGFELADPSELDTLCRAAREIAELQTDGLVLGFLRGRTLDVELNKHILSQAPNLKATLHREDCSNWRTAPHPSLPSLWEPAWTRKESDCSSGIPISASSTSAAPRVSTMTCTGPLTARA